MSRIFDALRRAERDHPLPREPEPVCASAVESGNRRRSPRLEMDVPVYVYGHELDKEPFHEETHTLNVNEQGALLLLSVPVYEGQKLLLTNALTQQDQHCQVVFLGARRTRTVEAGVAFSCRNPEFWHLPKQQHNGLHH